MANTAQKAVARKNVRKIQGVWQDASLRQGAGSQLESRSRTRPSVKGEGNYYRIVVRPSGQFTTFRTQDVGEPGGLQRLAGKRASGSWATQAWLVSKDSAHVEGKRLVPDNKDVKDLIRQLGSEPLREKGDIFTARDRSNVPEKGRSTTAYETSAKRKHKKDPSRAEKQR